MPDEATITPDAPETDTAAPESTQVDTPVSSAPETPEAAQPVAPATEQQSPDAPAPSTTPQQQTQSEPDWRDRYRELQSYADRRHNQYQTHLSQLQQELQQFRQQKEQAALKPWAKNHPEHSQFRGLLERSKAIHRQIQAVDKMPQEQRQATLEAIMAGVTPEEQQHLSQYREAMQGFQNEFFTDPETTLAPLIERGVQAAMAKVQADMAGKQQIDRDFSAPHLQPILQDPKYAGYLNEKLQKGVPYEEAMELLKLRAATDMMYRKLQGADRQVMHAQEQSRLVKGRAQTTVQPDPTSAPPDPYEMARKEAAKLGVAPGTAAYNRLIAKYTDKPQG